MAFFSLVLRTHLDGMPAYYSLSHFDHLLEHTYSLAIHKRKIRQSPPDWPILSEYVGLFPGMQGRSAERRELDSCNFLKIADLTLRPCWS